MPAAIRKALRLLNMFAAAACVLVAESVLAQAQVWVSPAIQPTVARPLDATFRVARDAGDNLISAGGCDDGKYDAICLIKQNGATGAILWTRTFNGFVRGTASHSASVTAIAVDAAGDAIVTGGCTLNGVVAYCTAKFNGATGALRWAASYSGQGLDAFPQALALDASGNAIVTGSCFSPAPNSKLDSCTVKHAGGSGAIVWQAVRALSPIAAAGVGTRSVAVDASGNAFVAATCNSDTFIANLDFCVYKYAAATGAPMWTAAFDSPPPFGGPSEDRLESLAVDAGGNPIVAGTCEDDVASFTFQPQICVVKFDAGTGAQSWSSVYADDMSGSERAVVRVDSGGWVWVGATCALYFNSQEFVYVYGFCLAKFNGANGVRLWQSTFQSAGLRSDTLDDLRIDLASGNALASGTCASSATNRNLCAAKFNGANGGTQWSATFANAQDEFFSTGFRAALDAGGNLAVVGRCNTAGGRDFCAVKLAAATGSLLWSRTGGFSGPTRAILGYEDGSHAQRTFARDSAGNLYVASQCADAFARIWCVSKVSGASGALLWSATFGNSVLGDAVPIALALNENKGSVIATGRCPTASAPSALCVATFSASTGAISWSAAYSAPGDPGNMGHSAGHAISVSASDDIFVTGRCRTGSNADLCVLKLAGGTGAILWTQLYNGPANGDDEGVDIALLASGNPVVTGTCAATSATDLCTLALNGVTGAVTWSRLRDFGGSDTAASIAVDTSSNVYVAGSCSQASNLDFCVLKYRGGDGALLWSGTFNGTGNTNDSAASMGLDASGNPVVAGNCRSLGAPFQSDICTAKFSTAGGAVLWSSYYSTAFEDVAGALSVDAAGNVFTTGSCHDAAGDADFCTIKYNGASGAQQWIHSINTGAYGSGAGLALATTTDAVFIAGNHHLLGEVASVRIYRVANDASAPSVVSVARASSNPISDVSSGSLFYNVTFSDAVTGVGASDFVLATTGTIANAAITGVTGSGSLYTVTLTHGTGTGTIRLDVIDNDTIVDASFNPLNGLGTGASYTGGEMFTVVGPLGFTTSSFPGGFYNAPYSGSVAATGGATPYAFTVLSGTLPPGIALSGAGAFTGTPTIPGTFNFTLRVGDSIGLVATHAYSITISPAPQTITFNTLTNKVMGAAPFVLSATGGASGNPVTFASQLPSVCTTSGTNGATVTLVAVGLCTIRASQSGNANYAAAPNVNRFFSVTPGTFLLSVSRSGPSSGTVTSSPAGINCGATCEASFATGGTVALGVIPNAGSNFIGWGGACTGIGTCFVTMDAAKSVTANFQPASVTLTVAKAGTGTGNVLSVPTGIDCGAGCSAAFNYGLSVTLTPTPAIGSQFAGWTGACTGSGACVVTMDSAKSATATFALVSNASSSVTMSFNPATVTCGALAPWTATVSGGYGTPTGTVTLNTPGGTSLGNYNLSGGVAASGMIFSGYNGVASYYVLYNGNGTYATSQSPPASITVTKATPAVVLASGNNPSMAGSDVTLTATVSRAGTCAIPGGSVTFMDGTAALGTVALDAAGVATLSTSGLSSGLHNLSAEYSGGSYYVAVTSSPLAQTVEQAASVRPDFDADGKGDLVFRNADGRVAVWLMDGTVPTSTGGVLGAGTDWHVAHVADLDGNGTSDLVWQNTDGRVTLYLMDGAVATTKTLILGAGAWTVTQAADLDGDGKADLVFQNGDGTIAAWLMNATAMSSGSSLLGPGTGWSVTKTADFDDNGKDDLLFTHTDGRVAIWLMEGLVPKATNQILNAKTGWSVTHTLDLDGDGKADLLWQHTDGSVAAWLMDGAAMSSGAGLLGAGTGWSVTRTGDFDGDGKRDLFFTHIDGRAAIYLMNGLVPATTTQILNAGSGWSARRIADLNGDGKADIVWEHGDGRAAVWLMNGTLMSVGSEILGPGTGWSVSDASQ